MKQWKAILLVLLALTASALAACPDHCDECDDSGSICFACQGDFQVNVFGGCHANTISKCVIYGPNDECFRCQPTYTLADGKCEKAYSGCVNQGGPGECFECAFGTTLDTNKCKGVINCADSDGAKCKKCKDGYTLSGAICKDSSAGCADVRPSDGICGKCKDGYFLSGFRCVKMDYKNDRCYVLADNHKCSYCKGGYNDADGKCLLNKEMGNGGQGSVAVVTTSSSNSFGDGGQGFSSSFGDNGQGSFSTSSSSSFSSSSSSFSNSNSNSFGGQSDFGGSGAGAGSGQAGAAVQNCQVPDPVNGGCIVCVYGFFPKAGKCQAVSELCDGHNVQTGDCFGCKNGLTLDAGKCVDKFCSSGKNGKCDTCMAGYKADSTGICKQFDPNCNNNANGRCQQCKSGYYADIAGKCKALPANCATANMQTGACLECVKDYEILSAGAPCTKKIVIENCQVPDTKNPGKCLICNYGYFPEGTKCSKASELCKDFNVQNGKCTSCISPGFTLNDGKCVDPNCATRKGDLCSACNPNFAFSATQKICKFADPNCKTLAIASCQECKQGFYASNDKVCKSLPLNCQSADGSGACLTCIQGFQINRGGCIKTVVIPNCASVDSPNNRCLNCNDRYFLSGSSCAPVSPNCNTYNSNNGWCLSCKSNMVVQPDGSCAVPPPPAPAVQNGQQGAQFNGQTNSQYNQQTVQGGFQQSNQGGFQQGGFQQSSQSTDQYNQAGYQGQGYQGQQSGQISQGQQYNQAYQGQQGGSGAQGQSSMGSAYNQQINTGVQVISSNGAAQGSDLNCREYNGGRCVRCSNRYYVNPDNRCVPVNPLCKQANQAGECTACYQGYRVDSGKCIISQATDPNCKSYQGQGCQECYQGYYYNQNDRICKRVNPLCKTSNPQSGACTGCYPGYSLNNLNGNCEVFFKDPNCKEFRPDGGCKTCSNRYYVNANGKCSAANPLCKEYNQNSGACTACYPGYGLTADGQCQAGVAIDNNCKNMQGSTCKECVTGFYLGQDGKCKQASPLCKTFDMYSGNCLTCYNGYEVSGPACVVAKSQDPHCKKVDGQNQCIACYQGYIAIRGKCLDQNPLCKTVDMNNGGCLTCWNGYTLSGTDCIIEKTPAASNDPYCLKMTDGVCSKCSSGYYFNRGQSLCAQLDPICKTNDMDNGDCTSCYAGYSLVSGKCGPAQVIQITNCLTVGQNGLCAECIQGTYLSGTECKQVSILCASYNRNNGECTSCVAGHFLQDGICIFPAIFDQNCVRYESAYCSRCRPGFFLSNFMCAPVDPNCVSFNYDQARCESCANGLYPQGSACQ